MRKKNCKNCLGFSYTKEEAQKFFNDYLTNKGKLPIDRVTINGFECFREYAKFFNSKDNNKEKNIGTEFMWQIVLEAKDHTLEQAVTEYIVDQFYEDINKNPKKSSEMLEDFMQQILLKDFKSAKEARASLILLKRLTSV